MILEAGCGLRNDKMNIYYDIKFKSYGINRVISALSESLPENIIRTTNPSDADLIVLHVIGRNKHVTKYARQLKEEGKEYVAIQYSLESTRNPDPKDWEYLWNNAKFVWSYYDLEKYISNFYHAPLASNPKIFYKEDQIKKYNVGTNGNCYKEECVGENQLATWQMGGQALHVGEKFNSDPIVTYMTNVTDDELRVLYNSCKYFSCLRRKDGFEIVAIESLLCGTRPVMFDTPNYRQWFDGLAEFIPEASVGETVGNLKHLFKKELRPVTDEEILEVKRRFNWKTIMGGFWENV